MKIGIVTQIIAINTARRTGIEKNATIIELMDNIQIRILVIRRYLAFRVIFI